MGKSFKGFSKALSLILAVAMVVTCVPTSAYAAELLAGESEDILISNDTVVEESSDALVNDASASEEKSSSLIDTQKEADLAAAPEENTAGEEEISPDKSEADFYYGVTASATTHFGVFTVNGDNPTSIGTLSTVVSGKVTNEKKYGDSVNGVEFYVVPVNGYEVTEANKATVITLDGSYKANDAASATDAVKIPDADWSVTKVDLGEMDVNTHDFKNAYKVKVNSGDWLTAYKTAQYNDANLTLTTDTTIVKDLVVTVDNDKFTAKPFPVTIVGAEAGRLSEKSLTLESDNTTAIDISAAFSNSSSWTGKTVEVALVKSGADDVEYAKNNVSYNDNTQTDADMTADGDVAYYWDAANKKVYISVEGIKEAYKAYLDGWSLTVSIVDEELATSASVTATSSLADVKGLKDKANGTIEKTATNYTAALSTTPIEIKDGSFYPFYVELKDGDEEHTSGRTIVGAKYSKDGVAPVDALPFDLDDGAAITNVTARTGVTYNGSAATDLVATPGYFAIPATAVVNDAVLDISVVTKEAVKFNASYDESNRSLVNINDGNDLAVAGTTVISAGVTSTATTGADYEFTVTPKAGYKVDSVSVKIWDVEGASVVTNKTLTEGNYGKYTVEKALVNGKMEFSIVASAKTGVNVAVSKTAGTTSEIKELKTGTVITSTANANLIKKDEEFKFSVTPAAGKYVSGVTYEMTDAPEGDDGEAVLVSTEIDGTAIYKIANVTGAVVLSATEATAATVYKTANPDAEIKIGTNELKDSAKAVVPTTEDEFSFTVTAKNGAEIKGVYFADLAESTAVTNTNKGTEITGTNGVYKLGRSTLAGATNLLKITVVTAREAENYSVSMSTDRADEKDITGFAMKAGYTATLASGSDATTKYTKLTLTPVITKSDRTQITSAAVGSATKWALADTSKNAKIVDLSSATVFKPNVMTTKLAGANTLNFEYSEGFPNAICYKKSLTVTTTALSSVYSKLELFNDVVQDGSDASGLTLASEDKTVRLDDSSLNIADSMTYGVMTYTIDEDGEEVAAGADKDYVAGTTAGAKIGDAGFIKKIEYEVTPDVESTRIDKPYTKTAADFGTGGSSNGLTVASFAEVDDFDITEGLTVTATVTFQDDSTTVVTDSLKVLDETFGYVAVPTVTVKGKEPVLNKTRIDLEVLSTGTNSASIKWDVYKLNVATLSNPLNTAENIAKELENEEIEPATGVYAEPVIDDDDKAYATITGTSNLSITALKKSSGPIVIAPKITVDGMPVKATNIQVYIDNNMPTYVVTVATKDTSSAINDYDYPQMTSGLATKTPISWTATSDTKGSAEEVYQGFKLTAVKSGEVITLPADTAIEGVNPKRALYGWQVVGTKLGTKYYKADGTQTVNVDENLTITALYAEKYKDGSTEALAVPGSVGLYSKIGDKYTSLANPTPDGAGSLTIASGKSIETCAGYFALDATKGPNASGDPQYATTRTYDAAGLTYSCTSETYNGVIEAPANGVITGKAVDGSVALSVKWVDGSNEFSKFAALSDAKAKIDVATLTVTASEAKVYTASIAAVNGLEKSESRALALSVKAGSSDKTYSDFASVSVTSSNESVATITKGTSFSDFKINAVGTGTATISFKVIDAEGAESNVATADVTVSPASVGIVATVVNAVTGTNGEVVAENAEMGVLVGGTNTLKLSLADNTTTSASDWSITASDPDTVDNTDTTKVVDVAAWDGTGAVSYSASGATSTPERLGIKTLTVTYRKTTGTGESAVTHVYTREIPVRSYYAVEVYGPKDDAEAALFEVDDANGTAIATGKSAFVRVPYVNGTKDKTPKYTAAILGFSAKQLDTTAGTYEFKGFNGSDAGVGNVNSAIVTDGSHLTYEADEAISYVEASPGWASHTTAGLLSLRAVFGEEALSLSNLPTTITLSDETLTTAAGVAGTDMTYVEVGVTPAKSSSKFTLTGTDANKFVLVDGSTSTATYPASGSGYATSDGQWDGSGKAITINKGAVVTTSRTDAFTIAKIKGDNKNYVGTSKIKVATPDNTKYAEITVYLNGEYDTGKTDTKGNKIYHYMENGSDIKAAAGSTVSRTVAGQVHFFDENGARVTDGVVDVNGKKVLIVSGAQRTLVGPFAVNDKGYYVGADGFVKVGGIFAGEAAADKSYKYYADENGELAKSSLVEVSGKTNYFGADYRMATAASDANLFAATSDGKYYVNAEGEVAIKGIFKVAGVDRLFTEEGKIVTYADTVEGKITVAGVVYVIDKDTNAAKRDEILYNAQVTWVTNFPAKWSKKEAIPTVTYKVTAISSTTGESKTSEVLNATVTPATVAADATEVTFTATADLTGYFEDKEGTKPAKAEPLTKSYTFPKGGETSGAGIEIVGLEEEYKFAGTAIKPAISVVDNDLGITLAEGTDYKISYKDNTKVGTATITLNGKGNYTGKNVTAQFKIVSATEGIEGLATKVNKVEKIAFNPTYNGEPQAPEKVTVVADGETIVYEWNGSEFQKKTDTTKDVGLTIVNNVNAGTATVAAVGADGKAKKANFKINKVDLSAVSAEQLAVEVEEEAEYLVKGAKPGVSVTYTPEGGSAIELINGQDFKVEYKYANKKNASEGNTIKIKGNGANFTKAKEVTDKPFKIVKHDLQDEDIVSVEAYTGIKPKKVKVVVKDSAGVVVPAKQYEVHVFTDEGLEITADKNAKLEAGKEYTIQVKASATGNLEGEASAKVTAQANIGKAKATLSASLKKDGVAYTGEPIDLENYQSGELIINYFESGIKLTLKGVGDLTYGEDFEVAGYVNNVNKGTMTVYVRGISDKCSGTLGIKIKISAKTMKKAE